MNYWEDYKVSVPVGISGDYCVEHFSVSEKDASLERIRSIMHGGRGVPAGNYTRLRRKNHLIMSDTPDEIDDHYMPIRMAHGKILINGLGLGIVLNAILKKPNVEHATVVEISPDVIILVGNYYQALYGNRLTLIQSDALSFCPPKGIRYNMVWHDIWNDICGDNLPEMTKLHRKYGRRTDWQDSWCKFECQQRR